MGYGQQKSCAEVIGFCDVFRTLQKHWSVSTTECVEGNCSPPLSAENAFPVNEIALPMNNAAGVT